VRILHIIRGLTNSSGTTHIVGPLAEAQARLGHQVSVYFVEKPPFEPVIPRADLVQTRSFPVTVLRKHPGVSIPYARAVDRDIGTFDVVHVHAVWNFPSLYAMRAAARAAVPYMVAPQGSLEPWALAGGSSLRQAYVARIEGPLLRRATRMQALTDEEALQCKHFGYMGPVSVIPNGVAPHWLDLERTSLANDLGLPDPSRTLLFLSRIHPKKGLDRLLRGFAIFSEEAPDVTLVVAGHDAGSGYLAEMKRLASELQLTDKCRFVGEVSGEQKRRALAGADLFALTSHSEGLPIAVLEAMACATPVVITPGCHLPEVADAKAGVIVAPEAEAAAAGLRAAFANTEGLRAMGRRGRHLVRERFTWPAIARQTIDAYGLMAKSKGHGAAA
jgi:poly(glycerol-phosphate) alpha-glucosyltransferase